MRVSFAFSSRITRDVLCSCAVTSWTILAVVSEEELPTDAILLHPVPLISFSLSHDPEGSTSVPLFDIMLNN